PEMAAFSSRGPSLATGDQLKPDLTAPGVDVIAGFSPRENNRLFEIVSGTSMSSPHVAGLSLLLKHRRPTWTPMMIKSALMTTGTNTLDSFAGSATASADANRAFAQGAGHVRPTTAADPGLVYNSGPGDWIRFLCGTGQLTGSLCAGGSIDPSDLNLASIAIGDLAGKQTITRRVTNVGSASETYTASVSGLPGIAAAVSPSTFTIAPGASQTYTVEFTRTTAAVNVYQAGHLIWASAGHTVRSPLVIRPVSLTAPAEVALVGGSASWTIKSGVNDTITLGKRGLLAAQTDAVTLADDPNNNFDTADPESNKNGVFKKEVVVPAGQAVLRFATFDVDTDGNDDLDMYLYRLGTGAPTLVALSAGATSQEVVTLRNPTAATYRIYVHAFETDGPDVNFTLFGWTLGTADAGNMTVNGPFAATVGSTHTVNVSATGLVAGTRYLGQVTYTGTATGPIGTPTIVTARG
ncbi:MAG TPA: S8 family serine peptidase, partial [Ilumatobacter sp.]|nr:S8 family serine peptidase [Ilumatobacter sp.]